MHRELRYKTLEEETVLESGVGHTIDVASGGVSFQIGHALAPGLPIELSISWPVLLEGSCPIRLIVFGRVLRSTARRSACCVDRYEFRTQARAPRPEFAARTDSVLQRWADCVRKETVKTASA